MPTITVDTFLACSLMLILVLSAMLSVPKIIQGHVDDLQGLELTEYYLQLAKYLMLNPGTPVDWGDAASSLPSTFGLAKKGSTCFYDLDIDKVSRLNADNEYAINYAQLFTMLNVKDVALEIELKPFFELSVSLASSEQNISETRYVFAFLSQKSGLPIACDVSCFVLAGNNFIQKVALSTNSEGKGTVTVDIPFTANGTAILVSLAKSTTNSRMVSYNVYCFGHNSPPPLPNATFTRLSPLDYNLTVSLKQLDFEVSGAWVFTFNYNFSLNKIAEESQRVFYEIPRLIDASPMIIVAACGNASVSHLEWVSYPQVPLQIGYEPVSSNMVIVASFMQAVAINDALYECVVTVGGLA